MREKRGKFLNFLCRGGGGDGVGLQRIEHVGVPAAAAAGTLRCEQ